MKNAFNPAGPCRPPFFRPVPSFTPALGISDPFGILPVPFSPKRFSDVFALSSFSCLERRLRRRFVSALRSSAMSLLQRVLLSVLFCQRVSAVRKTNLPNSHGVRVRFGSLRHFDAFGRREK